MPSYRFNRKKICYKTYGAGEAVVLIHGFAEDSRIWEKQIIALQKNYRLIVPDLGGSGDSELPAKSHSSLEDHAAAMVALLDTEGLEKAVLLGHSMGGYISLAFAEQHQERLTGLGLVHSGAYADDAEKIKTRKQAIHIIKQKSAGVFLNTAIPGLFADKEKSKLEIADLIKKGGSFSAAALTQYYEAMIARPDRTDVLKAIKVPVLFIAGEHDKAVPLRHSLEQCQLPDFSDIVIMRQSAHMSMLEETVKLNDALESFLKNVFTSPDQESASH